MFQEYRATDNRTSKLNLFIINSQKLKKEDGTYSIEEGLRVHNTPDDCCETRHGTGDEWQVFNSRGRVLSILYQYYTLRKDAVVRQVTKMTRSPSVNNKIYETQLYRTCPVSLFEDNAPAEKKVL